MHGNNIKLTIIFDVVWKNGECLSNYFTVEYCMPFSLEHKPDELVSGVNIVKKPALQLYLGKNKLPPWQTLPSKVSTSSKQFFLSPCMKIKSLLKNQCLRPN